VPAEPEPTPAQPPAPPASPAPTTIVEVTAPPSPVEMLRQVEPIADLDWLLRKATPLEEVQPLSPGEVVDQQPASDEYVEAELVDVEVVEEHGDGGARDEERPEGDDRGEGERPRRRRRRRGGRRSRRSREERGARPDTEPEEVAEGSDLESETVSDVVEASLEAAAESEAGTELEEEGGESAEPRERKGRRRRRRRGRRKPDGAPRTEDTVAGEPAGEGAAPQEDDDDEVEEDEGLLDTADVPLGMEDDEHDDHLDKNSHRAIPSWDEAIGMIVAVNMEARAKSPRSSGPPRGRGRGRGGRGNNQRGYNGTGGR
jgi:hypothetical protein